MSKLIQPLLFMLTLALLPASESWASETDREEEVPVNKSIVFAEVEGSGSSGLYDNDFFRPFANLNGGFVTGSVVFANVFEEQNGNFLFKIGLKNSNGYLQFFQNICDPQPNGRVSLMQKGQPHNYMTLFLDNFDQDPSKESLKTALETLLGKTQANSSGATFTSRSEDCSDVFTLFPQANTQEKNFMIQVLNEEEYSHMYGRPNIAITDGSYLELRRIEWKKGATVDFPYHNLLIRAETDMLDPYYTQTIFRVIEDTVSKRETSGNPENLTLGKS